MAETVQITNETRGSLLADQATITTSYYGRAKGLLGRRSLPPGEGLIIRPCNSVHCFFMAFSIDVVYVNAAYQVMRIVPDLRPWRVGPIVFGARDVIELPAGTLAATNTQAGDQLRVKSA